MHRSTITAKYQTTVPKAIRQQMGLSVADELWWQVRDGEIVVTAAKPRFLKRRGSIDAAPDPVAAVRTMRRRRGQA